MFRACSATGKNLDKLHDCSGPLWSDFSNDNVHPSSNPNFRCNLKLMLLSSPSLALLENGGLGGESTPPHFYSTRDLQPLQDCCWGREKREKGENSVYTFMISSLTRLLSGMW